MQNFQSHFCEMANFRCSRRYRTKKWWPMCETDTRILSNMAFFISFSHTSDLRSIIISWFMIHKNLWDFLIIMIDREWSPSQVGLFPGSIIRHFKSGDPYNFRKNISRELNLKCSKSDIRFIVSHLVTLGWLLGDMDLGSTWK